MEAVRVVVLSGRSLFADSTASSLRRIAECLDVDVLDPRESHVLERIAEVAPSIVVLDSEDTALTEECWVTSLLNVLPNLRVILLNPEGDRIQIVIGEHHKAANIAELVEVIGSMSTNRDMGEDSRRH